MRTIDFVPSVNIRRQQELVESLSETLYFVSRSVGSEHVLSIEVITIGQAPPWVIFGKSQIVKVLFDRDNGRERVEMFEGGEVGFDESAEDAEGMIRVEVEVAVQL